MSNRSMKFHTDIVSVLVILLTEKNQTDRHRQWCSTRVRQCTRVRLESTFLGLGLRFRTRF